MRAAQPVKGVASAGRTHAVATARRWRPPQQRELRELGREWPPRRPPGGAAARGADAAACSVAVPRPLLLLMPPPPPPPPPFLISCALPMVASALLSIRPCPRAQGRAAGGDAMLLAPIDARQHLKGHAHWDTGVIIH